MATHTQKQYSLQNIYLSSIELHHFLLPFSSSSPFHAPTLKLIVSFSLLFLIYVYAYAHQWEKSYFSFTQQSYYVFKKKCQNTFLFAYKVRHSCKDRSLSFQKFLKSCNQHSEGDAELCWHSKTTSATFGVKPPLSPS